MRKHNTPAARAQRNTLVKPEHLISEERGNTGATGRDVARFLNDGYRLTCFDKREDVFTLFVGPGEGFRKASRRDVERIAANVERVGAFPNSVDLEFSASPRSMFKAAEGLPEDYITSVVYWALHLSRSVVICVDTTPGIASGEPIRSLSPIQATFRCAADQVETWVEYLGRRVRPNQRFAVIRFAQQEARS